MTTILALDLGASCGWAVGFGPAPAASGRWNLAGRPGDSPGVAYLKLRSQLHSVKEAYPGLALVVTETAHHRGGASTRRALGYQAHVEAWCVESGIEHAGVATGTLKKHATGTGRADKDAMRVAARKLWTLDDDVTDDEVDARWVYDWARLTLMEGPR